MICPTIAGMTQLDLLFPFALPPQELARDLLRELKAPSLALLLARAQPAATSSNDEFSRALPHEHWLAQHLGLPAAPDNSSPPLAADMLHAVGIDAPDGFWFLLQPANFHIARDHLVLTDLRQLALPEQEAHTLFDSAAPLFAEAGKALHYVDAATWLLRADDWQALQTSTPDAACGHNIDIWMPHGAQARDWRRLQNEVQMHWHAHPVNEAREMRGSKPVNTIWLWGGAAVNTQNDNVGFDTAYTSGDPHAPFAAAAGAVHTDSAEAVIASREQHALLLLDDLLAPALSGDWAEWLVRFQAADERWFAPLLEAVRTGRLTRLSMTFSHGTATASYRVSKSALRKFWRAPSLSRLSA